VSIGVFSLQQGAKVRFIISSAFGHSSDVARSIGCKHDVYSSAAEMQSDRNFTLKREIERERERERERDKKKKKT
jgi:hypothetical protein